VTIDLIHGTVVRTICGDARTALAELADQSIHCVVTSPPYWGLRDYGVAGQIGLEKSPAEYVGEIVDAFRQVWRVLRDDGTLFLNLGDCYASGGGTGKQGTRGERFDRRHSQETLLDKRYFPELGLKPKDLVGIPWRVAFALQSDGWYLRQDNIWGKRNCMPESVRDRTTRAHEYVFMLTKSPTYFYDATAIEEDGAIPAGTRAAKGSASRAKVANGRPPEYAIYTGKRNKRTVWWETTTPFPDAHFATMPPSIVEPCILAGTSAYGCCPECGAQWTRMLGKKIPAEGRSSGNVERKIAVEGDRSRTNTHMGSSIPYESNIRLTVGWAPGCACDRMDVVPCVCLDPFSGADTTGLVAARTGRDSVLVDLNPDYHAMAWKRLLADRNSKITC
jgi:DNA modification methylase